VNPPARVATTLGTMTQRTHRVSGAVAAAIALSLTAWPALADPPAAAPSEPPPAIPERLQPLVDDAWVGVYFLKQKAGYANFKTTAEHVAGQPAVVTSGLMRMRLKGDEQDFELNTRLRFAYAVEPPYPLLMAQTVTSDGQSIEHFVVRRADLEPTAEPGETGYIATVRQGGEARRIPRPDLVHNLEESDLKVHDWLAAGPEPGETLAYATINHDRMVIETATATFVGPEPVTVGGRAVPAVRVDEVSEAGEKSSSWYAADDLRMLRESVAGGTIDLRREPQSVATAMGEAVEIFNATLVRLDRPLRADQPLRHVVLEIEGDPVEGLGDAPGQRVEPIDDGRYRLSITAGAGAPADPKDVEKALEETVFYPTTDPQVVALAEKATRGADTPQQKAAAVCRFVDRFITDDLNTEPLTVKDALKQKRGECSTHTAVFITLARAAGVPARDVGGYAYMGDGEKSLGGHAWAEVAIDGRWVPVDPTFGQMPADAGRIRLPIEDDLSGRPVLAKSKVRVVSVNEGPVDAAEVAVDATDDAAEDAAAAAAEARRAIEDAVGDHFDEGGTIEDVLGPTDATEAADGVRPGAAFSRDGVTVKTVAPKFSAGALASGTPTDPQVAVTFNRDGKVTAAELVRRSGVASIDAALLASVYRWRAEGEGLGEGGTTVRVTVRLGAAADEDGDG